MVNNLLANAGDTKDVSSIPWSERSPRGRHVKPVQYSCLENPMDRVAWRAAVHGVVKSQMGFPGGSDGKESVCSSGPGFNPWVGKIPWRRKWQPSPVFLPGESHGQRNLEGYSPWSRSVGHN